MKNLTKITAMLLCAAIAGGMVTAMPVNAETETTVTQTAGSVRDYTLDELMQMDAAQLDALSDFYAIGNCGYALAAEITAQDQQLELASGRECFFVKLDSPELADRMYSTTIVTDDKGEYTGESVLSYFDTAELLGIPRAIIENIEEGEAKGYVHVTVNLNHYGDACKTYILTLAKLIASENTADAFGMSIAGGRPIVQGTGIPGAHDDVIATSYGTVPPVTGTKPPAHTGTHAGTTRTTVGTTVTGSSTQNPNDTHTTVTESEDIGMLPAEQDTRTVFMERVAGWQNAKLEDCVILGDQLLTPDKPYRISRIRFTPFCVYTRDGSAPDKAEILAKWKEMLLANGYPENAGMWDFYDCELTASDDGGYFVKVPQDAYANVSLADCLKTMPDVQRITAQFGYRTDDRPNTAPNFSFHFTVDGLNMPQPDDFPELEGVRIAGDVPLPLMQTESDWSLTIPSRAYADYFAAAKYLQTLDFVHDLQLTYMPTELGDGSDDAKILEPDMTVLFERAEDAAGGAVTSTTRQETARESANGDLTLDGKTDVSDAVLLARFLAADANAKVSDQGLANADADGSGSITSEDLTKILLIIARR
ncbi:MAG: dockerin type I repeat-containing protein [Oscillospiraceae bacterium]|nr:dockerin type I repeat-containing protein [Oscillospiraceae bacterium]